ncbi:MAG: purine-binding chemotaxis protein CheW [Deltaproteobacteria bacterium]|nr:purine-binding chemotaxis protein CheW [Deltaproteobacteria bacterium]
MKASTLPTSLASSGLSDTSIFQIHGDLDGGQIGDFEAREQVIGVCIGDDHFFLPLKAIQEITMVPAITFIPNADPYIDGITNLRGNLIPVINVRKLMGFNRGARSAGERLVVLKECHVTFALIVDGISEVIGLRPHEIDTPPSSLGASFDFMPRVSKQGDNIRGIIDAARILKYVVGDDASVT